MKSWSKQQLHLLGLNHKEMKILGRLSETKALNTLTASELTNIPRITVRRLLLGLQKRGFVLQTKCGNSVLWTLVNSNKIKDKAVTTLNSDSLLTSYIGLSEVGSLTIYRGVEEMIESNRNMLKAHPGERVLAIEPNGIWKYFAQVDPDPVHELNLLWKEKKILVEMVAEEGFEKVITDTVESKIEQSFLSLAVDIKIVPQGTLDSATEILIFRDQMLLMDWAHSVAVEIKNPSTLRVIKAMFRTLQASGRDHPR